ncbi:MAG: hypothetical protein AAF429_15110 [Pseudomonadota bacterium]
MKIVTLTATALLATAISASAMTNATAVANQVSALGFDGAVVGTLSDAEITKLKFALHNGEDSDIRGQVRSILNAAK